MKKAVKMENVKNFMDTITNLCFDKERYLTDKPISKSRRQSLVGRAHIIYDAALSKGATEDELVRIGKFGKLAYLSGTGTGNYDMTLAENDLGIKELEQKYRFGKE